MKNLDMKLENFQKATARLSEACALYDNGNDIVRDSIIQRFEFTFTVANAALKAFMQNEGVVFENSFPRTIFKQAFANKLIGNEKAWLNLIEDRNLTSHIYSESVANEIAQRIKDVYASEFKMLCDKLCARGIEND